MYSDAHLHFADLEGRDPGFLAHFAAGPYLACAASHDEAEFGATLDLIRAGERAGGAAGAAGAVGQATGSAAGLAPRTVLSFGIHPQSAVWKDADFLARLAAEGRIGAIGEAGFDFFGDRPERVRNEGNERTQVAVFEYQLGIAELRGLPMVLHVRKAMDLVFVYAKRLSRLPAVVLHSYSGTAREGADLLARGVPAYFSFGAAVLNSHKRAIEACTLLPEERLLSETDAPWQPPRGSDFCRFEAIADIEAGMARLRGADPALLAAALEANFRAAYGLPARV
jgi:TatD DNase family protein